MFTKLAVSIALFFALAGFAFGGAPVAIVTSSGSFDLHGSAVKTDGIPSWPVMAGDEIVTHASAALIRFQDGTSVALGENSRAKVETVDGVLVFRLFGGAMQVTGTQTSAVRFYDGNRPVAVHSGVNPSVGTGSSMYERLHITAPPPPAPVSGK
jgi:hypothetical protein